MKKLFIILIFSFFQILPKNDSFNVIIIIPGTWALKEKWFCIGGDFFEELNTQAKKKSIKVTSFRWLTDNNEESREKGAQELCSFLSCFEPKTNLHLIAHSHGTNVAIKACQLLFNKQPERKIRTLIALGAPVDEETYKPNMTIIKKFINLYSFNDGIQTFWAWKRIFHHQPGIHNLHTFINDHEPTHAEMHHPLIAQWLIYLMKYNLPDEATVRLFDKKNPLIEENLKQNENLENDKPLNLNALIDWRKALTKKQASLVLSPPAFLLPDPKYH